ncbi:hypothetical protein, partial [Clostridium sp.]|uniref:hypothetical protein n=1 Tax=Clostridium sp. TaxID=1506 RepID=UPI0035A18BDB
DNVNAFVLASDGPREMFELIKNPVNIKYISYAGLFNLKLNQVSLFLVSQFHQKDIEYKPAVDKAIRKAKKLLKRIQKETQCDLSTTAVIARELIRDICFTAYQVYFPEKLDDYNRSLIEHLKKIDALTENAPPPFTDKRNDHFNKERERLEKEVERTSLNYYSNSYKL